MKTNFGVIPVVLLAWLIQLCDYGSGLAVDFRRLGTIDNKVTESMAYSVSGNGKVVFGLQQNHKVFRWTESEGMTEITDDRINAVIPVHTNYDGTTAVGFSSMWSEANGNARIPGFSPADVSSDGSVLIGDGPDGVYRSHQTEGLVKLIDGASAIALSGDARVVVGARKGKSFRWAEGEAEVTLWSTVNSGFPWDLSHDGSVIVGSNYRWSAQDGVTALGGTALGVSADGSVIVGEIPSTNFQSEAVMWDADLQMHRVKDLLISTGVEIGDFQLNYATGISDDGTVIVGIGTHPRGRRREAWRIDFFDYESGDFNKSRILDADDVDLLIAAQGQNDAGQFDLNSDEAVGFDDLRYWVEELAHTYFGDANLDGEFNSGDLVQVFQAGEYDDQVAANSTWSEGDWDGNREFDSGDLVLAFQRGGFENGPRPALVVVPEPANSISAVFIVALLVAARRQA
jgi:uncharacterized membrane protein